MTLRDRWLAAMRHSTTRAWGRECDYAMSEGDVDKFDPLGLLAYTYQNMCLANTITGPCIWFPVSYHGEDGGCVFRQDAEMLANLAGFPPDCLYALALLNDSGTAWNDMADWAEAQ